MLLAESAEKDAIISTLKKDLTNLRAELLSSEEAKDVTIARYKQDCENLQTSLTKSIEKKEEAYNILKQEFAGYKKDVSAAKQAYEAQIASSQETWQPPRRSQSSLRWR